MSLNSGRDRIHWDIRSNQCILIKHSKNILISAWQNLALPVKQSHEKEEKLPLLSFRKVFPQDNSYRRRDINMVIGPREISSHLRHKAPHWAPDKKKLDETVTGSDYDIWWPQGVVWLFSFAEIYLNGKILKKMQ